MRKTPLVAALLLPAMLLAAGVARGDDPKKPPAPRKDRPVDQVPAAPRGVPGRRRDRPVPAPSRAPPALSHAGGAVDEGCGRATGRLECLL